MFRTPLLVICLACVAASPAAHGEEFVIKTLAQEGNTAKFNTANPKKPGICVEILRALERVDPALRFTGVESLATQKRIEQEIEAGSLDFFCGMKKTPERAERFVFIDEPLLYRQNSWLVARADDKVKINGLDDVRKLGKDGVVLTIQNNIQAIYMKSQPGIIVDDGAIGINENLAKLIAGHGRFYYGPDLLIREGIDQGDLAKKLRILKEVRFPGDDLLAAFSKKTPPPAIARFKAALQKLEKSGALKKITRKYTL